MAVRHQAEHRHTDRPVQKEARHMGTPAPRASTTAFVLYLRFLVLSRDGVVEPNLLWKDTVLVRTGQTVDILLDVTNPGVWMAHCHIAEHHESGMMFSFHVVA